MTLTRQPHSPDQHLPANYTFHGVVTPDGIALTVVDLDGNLIYQAHGDDEAADALEHVARMVTR